MILPPLSIEVKDYVMVKRQRMFEIPNALGVPAAILTFFIGLFKFFEQGDIMGVIISGLVSLLTGIYLYYKIKGQQLDNQKKNLRLSNLKNS
jgi:hypothetical protein